MGAPTPSSRERDYAGVIEEYSSRFLVRPGITGLAQVMGFRGATPDIESMAAVATIRNPQSARIVIPHPWVEVSDFPAYPFRHRNTDSRTRPGSDP